MAQVVDSKGKTKAAPSGKVFDKGSKNNAASKKNVVKDNSAVSAFDDIVQTASIPSRNRSRFNTLPKVSYNAVSNTVKSKPSSMSNTEDENDLDVSWNAPNTALLANGMSVDMPSNRDDSSNNLPDLNPAIEDIRSYLSDKMTKNNDDNQISFPPVGTGAVPSVDSMSTMSSGKTIDLPNISPAIDNFRDYLQKSFRDTSSDPGMIDLPMTSSGYIPTVNSDNLKQNDSPLEINIPSFDGIRDSLLSAMTKPVPDESAVAMSQTSGGATPLVDRDSLSTSGGIIDGIVNDPMLDYIGDTDSNNAYIQDAIANGMSEDEAKYITDRYANDNRGLTGWAKDLASAMSLPMAIPGDQRDSRDQGGLLSGSTVLDDGSVYDYDHMTSDNMTGTQYLHYAEMGMGGRPINEIDPTAVYSKRRENVNYGFVPFTPDSLSYKNMVMDNVLDAPARLGSLVGRGREEVANRINPYGININGKHVNGPEFDRVGGAYLHQMERDERYNPEKFLVPGDERAIPTVVEYPIPDTNGDITYHYGHLTGAYTDTAPDGSDVYGLEFSDGSEVQVSPDFFESITTPDGMINLSDPSVVDRRIVTPDTARGQLPDLTTMNDIDEIMRSGDPINNADVLWYPDLVMSDGTRLSYDEANSIYYDRDIEDNPNDPYDDNVTYDITSSIIPTLDNRPSRLNGEIFGDDGINISSLGNNVSDWTLGSLPISIGSTTPWIYSASNASSSMSGIDPSTYDVASDSYGLAYGNYDDNGNLRYGVTTANGDIDESLADEMQFWNMLGNAAVPLTEQIVGPVGEHGIPVRKLLNAELPAVPTTRQVIEDLLVGMAEEGVEEDLGNIFDELTSYGPRGMFANQVNNEDGRPMYDLTGHEVRDYSTSGRDRVGNMMDFNDLANSFVGGALVDLAMQAAPGSQFRDNMNRSRNAARIRRDLGIDRYVEPTEVEHVDVSDSYLDQFDDGLTDSIRR